MIRPWIGSPWMTESICCLVRMAAMGLRGSCRLGFEVRSHIFANLLHRAARIELARDLHTVQLSRVDASLYRVRFIHVQTHRSVSVPDRVQCMRLFHHAQSCFPSYLHHRPYPNQITYGAPECQSP